MAKLKLKITKSILKRKLEGVTVTGYYGRVITNGKVSFDDIARESSKNTTLHPKEASLAAELLLEGVCAKLKQGFIVDLGPLGTLYPAVSGKWEEDPKDLALADMTPRVNYKGSDDIIAAIKGATLSWATEKDEKEGVETPDDDTTNSGNQGGNNNPPSGELEG